MAATLSSSSSTYPADSQPFFVSTYYISTGLTRREVDVEKFNHRERLTNMKIKDLALHAFKRDLPYTIAIIKEKNSSGEEEDHWFDARILNDYIENKGLYNLTNMKYTPGYGYARVLRQTTHIFYFTLYKGSSNLIPLTELSWSLNEWIIREKTDESKKSMKGSSTSYYLKISWSLTREDESAIKQEFIKCFLAANNPDLPSSDLSDKLYELGNLYQRGSGIKVSLKEAFDCYKRAADAGHLTALVKLGICYARNQGIEPLPENATRAFKCFEAATHRGQSDAWYNLGLCYASGRGVDCSPEKALECFREAANRGHILAWYKLGVFYTNNTGMKPLPENATHAFNCFNRAAVGEQLDDALYHLGLCYANGRGTEYSAQRAYEYFKKAAEREHVGALYHLGLCFAENRGVGNALGNVDCALKYFRKAADKGHPDAWYHLGLCYKTEKGMVPSPENARTALKCFEEAAAKGHLDALSNLAEYYKTKKEQEPSPENERLALDYAKKLAERELELKHRITFIC